jgi:Protein of unknown function (DUF3223)
MPGHELIIGSQDSGTHKRFASKNDATLFFRAILGRYGDGQDLDEPDSQLLRDLLERHPEAQQKIGVGIKRFFKRRTDQGTSCFWLEREDGSTTDFSYIACIRERDKSLYQKFAEACRQAVQPELTSAKKAHFERYGNADGKVKCEVTGELVGVYESHLDHKKPMTFQVIVETFLKANQLEIKLGMLSPPNDAQFVVTFVDEDVAQRFRDYHGRIVGDAGLRIIKARSNLSLGGSERITKPKRPVIL